MKKLNLVIATMVIAWNMFANITPARKADERNKYAQSEKEKIQLTESLPGTSATLHSASGMCFTPNMGQISQMNGKPCPDVLYKVERNGVDIYLRKTGISYAYSNLSQIQREIQEEVVNLEHSMVGLSDKEEVEFKQDMLQKKHIKVHRVDMDFAGCNKDLITTKEGELDGYNNYYYAHCPNGIINVKQYSKITYKNIYDNIDVTYFGDKQNGLKYDLVVQPHADPNQIKLNWKGAESIRINREGSLVIKTSVNEFTESIPKVYQFINGEIVDIQAEYVLSQCREENDSQLIRENNPGTEDMRDSVTLITFKLGYYNRDFPLIIDPWATYYGGSLGDTSSDITTDNIGDVVVVGFTFSTNFPVLGGHQMLYNGNTDAMVLKFKATGARIWATYYGGNYFDYGRDVATDGLNNICITGETQSSNFPVGAIAGNVVQQSLFGTGVRDAFVVKFNSAGARIWGTFYGGNANDWSNGIATDKLGNVVIAGATLSVNFPVSVGTFQLTLKGAKDAFIVKFSPTGARLWGTYYGGSADETGESIATDITNNVVITGETQSADFPILAAGGYSQPFGGSPRWDAFVVKFNPTGTRLWATYYGGSNDDEMGRNIATDITGNIIITGRTKSTGFPVLSGFQMTYGGGTGDAYLVKFSPLGVRLWATFFGSTFEQFGWSLATDSNSNIYLLTETEDANSPSLVNTCGWQTVFNGGSSIDPYGGYPEDVLIVKFTSAGKKVCATYVGGVGEDDFDWGGGIALNGNSLYVTGLTDGGFPATPGAFQTNFAGPAYGMGLAFGDGDIFIASLCTNICEGKTIGINYTANSVSVCTNAPVTFSPSVSNSCDTTGYKFHWTFTGGTPANSDLVKPTVSFSGVGTHNVKLVVETTCKKDSITKVNYIAVNSCGCLLSGQTKNITNVSCNSGSNGSATITISNGSGGLYTYKWSNGSSSTTTSTSNTVTNLSAGTYTITISDGLCTATSTASIFSPSPLVGQFIKGNASCIGCGCKEWIMVNAIGGTSPYTYLWSDGSANRYKNKLCPGTYSITIKDKNNCNMLINLTAP